MRYIKLLIMLILLSIAAVGNCQNLQKAGETDVGVLYVDVDSAQSLSKSGHSCIWLCLRRSSSQTLNF